MNHEMVLLTKHKCTPTTQSLDHWIPLSFGFLKLNFDGSSKGNLGKAGYGFIVRNSTSEMMGSGYGFMGHDTNNAAEIEGLLHGLGWVSANFRIPIIVEGDSQMIILLATKLGLHLPLRLDNQNLFVVLFQKNK